MAEEKLSAKPLRTLPLNAGDQIVVITDPSGTPANELQDVKTFFSTITANVNITSTKVDSSANTTFTGDMRVTSSTPASNDAAAEGRGQGAIWFDSTYLYIATGANTIKRVTLEVF